MADEADNTPALRSSARSAVPAGSAATVVAGTRRAATTAATNITDANPITAPGPTSRSRAPGMPAAKPLRPDSSCSLLLASTRPASLCTTVGTIAALATW